MRPEVEKGDIVNLAPYHFYMKTSGDESEDAFSGQTVPLEVDEDEKILKAVVVNSRAKYSTPRAIVEERMETLFKTERQTTQSVLVRRNTTPPWTESDVNEDRRTHGI